MAKFGTILIAQAHIEEETTKTLGITGPDQKHVMVGEGQLGGVEKIATGNHYGQCELVAPGQGNAEREDCQAIPVAKYGTIVFEENITTTSCGREAQVLSPLVSLPTQLETLLAAEVQGIYASLLMVVPKSVHLHAAQPSQISSLVSDEQWQVLAALLNTLLYEHHDFLMVGLPMLSTRSFYTYMLQATQFPSAATTLQPLASDYSIRSRMWSHKIHSFPELLFQGYIARDDNIDVQKVRQLHQPHSQYYMLAKKYLLCHITPICHAIVSSFTSTWTECLGGLDRYKMGCDKDDQHKLWTEVATEWYTTAHHVWVTLGRCIHYTGFWERSNLLESNAYSRLSASMLPSLRLRQFYNTLYKSTVQNNERLAEHWAFLYRNISSVEFLLDTMLEEADYKYSTYMVSESASLLLDSIDRVLGNVSSEEDIHARKQPELDAEMPTDPRSSTGLYGVLMKRLVSARIFPGWQSIKSSLSILLNSWTIRICLFMHFFPMLPRAAATALPDHVVQNITSAGETDVSSTDEPHQNLVHLTLSYLIPSVILLIGALLAYLRFRNTDQQYQSPKRSRVIAGMTAVASCLFSLTDNELGPVAASISVAFQMMFVAEQCFDVRNVGLYVALVIIFTATLTFLIATILAPSTTSAATRDSQMVLVIHTAISIAPGINTLMAWLLFLVLRERPRRDDGQTPEVELQLRRPGADVGAADDSNPPP
nr:hypothetical protein CFP56_07879 [Quercus suber]